MSAKDTRTHEAECIASISAHANVCLSTTTEHHVIQLSAIQSIQGEYITDFHCALLKAFNITATREGDQVALSIEGEFGLVGPGIESEHWWVAWLIENQLDTHRDEPIIATMFELLSDGQSVEWDVLVQMLLRGLPETAIKHLDFQGWYTYTAEAMTDRSARRAGQYGGLAYRITRDAILSAVPPPTFFAELDRLAEINENPAIGALGGFERTERGLAIALASTLVDCCLPLSTVIQASYPNFNADDVPEEVSDRLRGEVAQYLYMAGTVASRANADD